MIIDFHAHIFPEAIKDKAVQYVGNYYNIPVEGRGDALDLLESMDRANVDKAVVLCTATRENQVESMNSYLSTVISERLLAFGTMHHDYKEKEKEIRRIKALGLKGIKLHPDFQFINSDDRQLFEIYEVAQAEKLPVLIHAGDENEEFSSPKRLKTVIENFKNLTLIAAHFGGYRKLEEAEEYIYNKNIYIDTSSTLWYADHRKVEHLIKKHGAEKILFGTDYPIIYHENELSLFYKLNLTEFEREHILYKNAERLLNI